MGATTQTTTFNTVASLALDKLSDKIADAISTGNKLLYFYKKKGNWKGIDFGGSQLRTPVMYQLQTVQPIGAYGTVNINAVESDTSSYWAWVQTAVPVSFSDLEEFRTGGSESIESIVDAKYRQAKAAADDFFSKSMLRGQGQIDTTSLTTPITSSVDGSVFVDPLPLLVKFDPTTSTTVGGIAQATNSWWQNQKFTSVATTLTAFMGELRRLHVLCQRGGGGTSNGRPYDARGAGAQQGQRKKEGESGTGPGRAESKRSASLIWCKSRRLRKSAGEGIVRGFNLCERRYP